jgi:hypothetical protein
MRIALLTSTRSSSSSPLQSKGFKDQLYEIYRFLPPQTQVVLVSATMPHDVLEVTTKFMNDPVRILVKRDELTLEGIKQFFVAVEKEEWKFDTLTDLYDILTITQAVIFCQSHGNTETVRAGDTVNVRSKSRAFLSPSRNETQRSRNAKSFDFGISCICCVSLWFCRQHEGTHSIRTPLSFYFLTQRRRAFEAASR